jgi:predicted 2-oxoglutarate/Fe(II)-dependent dioxygenase YbiX
VHRKNFAAVKAEQELLRTTLEAIIHEVARNRMNNSRHFGAHLSRSATVPRFSRETKGNAMRLFRTLTSLLFKAEQTEKDFHEILAFVFTWHKNALQPILHKVHQVDVFDVVLSPKV